MACDLCHVGNTCRKKRRCECRFESRGCVWCSQGMVHRTVMRSQLCMLFGPDARGFFINTPSNFELHMEPCSVQEGMRMRRQLQMQPSRCQTLL